jgi:hypothetical protein
VKRTPAEQILGEWGPRDGTVEWQQEGARLDHEGLAGRPLQRRLRSPFGPSTEIYARAVGGLPAHMRRLRKIEEAVDAHVERLGAAYDELAAECEDEPESFGDRWCAVARRWRFDEVNDLIGRHNRWYPAEARLPMDPRTGDFVPVGGRSYRREPLDAAWILERFPAALPEAAAAWCPRRKHGNTTSQGTTLRPWRRKPDRSSSTKSSTRRRTRYADSRSPRSANGATRH